MTGPHPPPVPYPGGPAGPGLPYGALPMPEMPALPVAPTFVLRAERYMLALPVLGPLAMAIGVALKAEQVRLGVIAGVLSLLVFLPEGALGLRGRVLLTEDLLEIRGRFRTRRFARRDLQPPLLDRANQARLILRSRDQRAGFLAGTSWGTGLVELAERMGAVDVTGWPVKEIDRVFPGARSWHERHILLVVLLAVLAVAAVAAVIAWQM